MVRLRRSSVVHVMLDRFTNVRGYEVVNHVNEISTSGVDFIRAKDYLQLVRLHNIVIPILGRIVHFMGTNVLKQQRDNKW